MIEAILFDSGGVIVQSVFSTKRFPNAFENHYELPPGTLMQAINPVWNKYMKQEIDEETFWNHVYNTIERPVDIPTAKQLYADCIQPVPGTKELIESLKKTYILGLVNNETKEFDEIRGGKISFFPLFDYHFSSWKIRCMKPENKYYETILETLNIPPEHIIFIDDKQAYVTAAQQHGMNAIQFISAGQTKKELRRYGVRC